MIRATIGAACHDRFAPRHLRGDCQAADRNGVSEMKVTIKENSPVWNDFCCTAWPQLRGEIAPVDTVFDAAPFGSAQPDYLTLKAPGYGVIGDYGGGSLFVKAEHCEEAK
jgi:hypothetical protein